MMQFFPLFIATGHPVFYLIYRAQRLAQARREESKTA